jgi:hypothetical protein
MTESSSLPYFDFAQVLPPFGLQLPARMSALPLGPGRVALVSPIPIDDATATKIAVLGEVAYLIAPNLLHHMYMADAQRRYPNARVLAPGALRAKRPDLRIDLALEEPLPEELTRAVDVRQVLGAPALDEFVFFHRATRTLLVTDLVFNIERPRGWFAHLLFFLAGTRKRFAASRAIRFMVKDRARCQTSLREILALPFETLIMAHGEIVRAEARARLAHAFAWLSPERSALPVST